METIVRNVRDLNVADRSTVERLVGHDLRESQQLVIQVMGVTVESQAAVAGSAGQLPAWCDVYEGLTDQEIDNLSESIVRSHSSRDIT